jgi:hypothetical protein
LIHSPYTCLDPPENPHVGGSIPPLATSKLLRAR